MSTNGRELGGILAHLAKVLRYASDLERRQKKVKRAVRELDKFARATLASHETRIEELEKRRRRR